MDITIEGCIPGTHCAETLLSMRLPLAEVIRVLMKEVDLTVDEAVAAVIAVQARHALAMTAERGHALKRGRLTDRKHGPRPTATSRERGARTPKDRSLERK